MKLRSIISLSIALLMLLALAACGDTGKPATTTDAADNTTAASTPDQTTAEQTTAEQTTEEQTTAEQVTDEVTTEEENPVIEYGLNGYGKLEGAERQALIDLLPALLPDNTPIEEFCRPFCGDDVFDADGLPDNFSLSGNSGPNSRLCGVEEGALYGLAYRLPAYGQNLEKRAEITVSFYNLDDNIINNVQGVRGILFYVDMSHVTAKEDAPLCASVTLNGNDYRANMADHGSVGYYYKDGAWVETKNVNACRMEVPAGFCGWIYVPATSYCDSNKNPVVDANGKFNDIAVENMRCYTDGYVYTDAAENYIIFDEIIYVY